MLIPVYYAFTGGTTLVSFVLIYNSSLIRSTVSDNLKVPVISAPYIPLTFKYISAISYYS